MFALLSVCGIIRVNCMIIQAHQMHETESLEGEDDVSKITTTVVPPGVNSDVINEIVHDDCDRLLRRHLFAAKNGQNFNSKISSNLKISTTTVDPIEIWCECACLDGVGGATCNCPDHPIG